MTVLIGIARSCIWFVALVALFVPLERLFALHPQKLFRKAIGVDIGYYFLNSLLPAFLLSLPAAVIIWGTHRLVPVFVLTAVAALPLAAHALLVLVVGEFGYYWGHRWTHEIPLLWRFHAVHHSAEHLDFLVNTRAHPLDMAFVRICGLIPLNILGLGGPLGSGNNLILVAVTLLGIVWGFFIHANLRWRLGPLKWIISTPRFHHWHHTQPEPRDRNYASMLPVMDRIFGTHYLPDGAWPVSYGIDGKMAQSLSGQLAQPFGSKIWAER